MFPLLASSDLLLLLTARTNIVFPSWKKALKRQKGEIWLAGPQRKREIFGKSLLVATLLVVMGKERKKALSSKIAIALSPQRRRCVQEKEKIPSHDFHLFPFYIFLFYVRKIQAQSSLSLSLSLSLFTYWNERRRVTVFQSGLNS